ncbi:MAG: hypothetical protein D6742_15855, partial [Cyanobacteria bacterium J069]
NGKGVAPDFGSQYRPIIFTCNERQKAIARASLAGCPSSTKNAADLDPTTFALM